ncbi:MAG: Flp family type IVb pilin [Gemmatimonadota bacterium]|nr:Flp family type IVb pilin [Gemmatimonadota bacterium]
MVTFWNALLNDESGQDLAEYALLIALIAIVVIAAVTLLGTNISGVFDSIATTLGGATS